MEKALKIIVIGNYNFAYHSHNATNKALQHVEKVLDRTINFYWLSEQEFYELDLSDFTITYDGVFIAPGPFMKPFYFNSILESLLSFDIPVLGTGEVYRMLIKYYFEGKGFDTKTEKIISENLLNGNHFSQINLDKLSAECSKLYIHRGAIEYTSERYSILPQYSDILSEDFEIGARNQYFDPELIKYKSHPFFMFTMFCPQINSTEDIPHPIITYFIKNAIRISDIKETEMLGQ